jgi:hypothetical protein
VAEETVDAGCSWPMRRAKEVTLLPPPAPQSLAAIREMLA